MNTTIAGLEVASVVALPAPAVVRTVPGAGSLEGRGIVPAWEPDVHAELVPALEVRLAAWAASYRELTRW